MTTIIRSFIDSPHLYLWVGIFSGLLIMVGGYQAMKDTQRRKNENEELKTKLNKLENVGTKTITNGDSIIVSQETIKEIQIGIKRTVENTNSLQASMNQFARKNAQLEKNYKANRLQDSKNTYNSTIEVLIGWIERITYGGYYREFENRELTRNQIIKINQLFIGLESNIYLSENPNLKKKIIVLHDYVDSAMRGITFYDDMNSPLKTLRKEYQGWMDDYLKFKQDNEHHK